MKGTKGMLAYNLCVTCSIKATKRQVRNAHMKIFALGPFSFKELAFVIGIKVEEAEIRRENFCSSYFPFIRCHAGSFREEMRVHVP